MFIMDIQKSFTKPIFSNSLLVSLVCPANHHLISTILYGREVVLNQDLTIAWRQIDSLLGSWVPVVTFLSDPVLKIYPDQLLNELPLIAYSIVDCNISEWLNLGRHKQERIPDTHSINQWMGHFLGLLVQTTEPSEGRNGECPDHVMWPFEICVGVMDQPALIY